MNITLLVLIIFVPLLAIILLGLNTLLAPHKAYEEKLSAYEAGMPVIPGQTRESFQIHYWLVAMLFLVFDIELVLLLPISVSLYQISLFGFVIAIIFFIVLTIGFIFEIGVGALSLKSDNIVKNTSITPNNKNSTNNNKIINNNYTKLYEFNTLDSTSHLSSLLPVIVKENINSELPTPPATQPTSTQLNEEGAEDYKKFLNDKSLILKKKLESGKYILSNLDLSIFKVVFEDHEHIFLRHVDIDNCYKVEVSILKYNPNIRGDLLFYYLTYTELKVNSFLLIEETVKFKTSWLKKINSGFIGNGTHSLELYIENYNLKAKDNQRIEILKFLLIADEVINNFSNISSDDLKNNNDKNLQTVFIINGKLVDIGYNLTIYFKDIFNNTNDFIKLTVNFNSTPSENIGLVNNVFTLIVFKNKLKLDESLQLDKNGEIKGALNIKAILKSKIKAKPSGITENNNIIQNNCRLIENVILNNIPIIFFIKHLSININKYIEMNNKFRKKQWNLFLRSGPKATTTKNNLTSTFLSVLTKDKRGKNIFNILHLNHFTGYISNYINIKTYENFSTENTRNVVNKGFKIDENLKLCHFILTEISNLQNIMFSNINLIQLSVNFLGSVNTINNLRKNKLLKVLNRIESKKNVKFEIIDITKYRKQECLQMFYILYNNNPNIKLEELIKNYNALIAKRKKTIENKYFDL